ncbi:AAA family ATPase [Saccharothrix sp. S26]|uniref:AAA family ATPase n=1 Tax=Saccharothrix sp. S26 TaxID=2907215 RepID=UPI001F31F55A|nr:AAA family ATPase [Saccharothrix sp. S26]MCE6999591.1 AAA family ATPase [Saccharothrix sp. S26]
MTLVYGTDPPSAETPPGRHIRLTPASGIRMRAVRWIWQDRVPAGSLSLVPGREGIGKSQFACWLAAQVTNGTLPGALHGEPRPVIYAATEDSWAHTVAPRLAAAGADLDAVYRAEVDVDGIVTGLTLPRDCEALGDEITARGVGLLILDPLLSVIGAGIDTHRDRELRQALEPLARMADRTGCAVVGLAHFNKSASPDPLNLITGSRAFSAVARAVLAVARDEESDDGACVISLAKNNLGRLDLPSLGYRIESAVIPTDDGPAEVGRLVMMGETERSVRDILAETGADPEARLERDEAAGWLRDYLIQHGGSGKAAEIIKAARADGIAEATLKRARKRAGIATTRQGFGQGSVWSLDL